MSRILALMAVALSAWYLGSRQRRTQLQHRWQNMVASLRGAGGKGAPATLDEMAAATTSAVAGMAESAGRVATRNAPEVTGTAAQGAGGAATSVREASGVVANRVQHAPQME